MKVAELLRGRQFAILPEAMRTLCDHAEKDFDLPAFEAAAPSHQEAGATRVAVMPMFGTIVQHGRYGTPTSQWGREFQRLVADSSIGSIVIHANSPGGEVFGTQELSDLIYRARGKKRVVTAVDSMAASAMYWIGTAASEVYITDGGEVGSIGVLTWHEDVSKAEENFGVKTELIAVPEAKIEGHPFGPLPADVRDRIVGELSETHDRFMRAVARNRGVGIDAVRGGFGGGRMVRAKAAVAEGMADGVAPFPEVVENEVKRLRQMQKGRRDREMQINAAL